MSSYEMKNSGESVAKTGSRQCQTKQMVGLADKSRKLARMVNGKILGIGKRKGPALPFGNSRALTVLGSCRASNSQANVHAGPHIPSLALSLSSSATTSLSLSLSSVL